MVRSYYGQNRWRKIVVLRCRICVATNTAATTTMTTAIRIHAQVAIGFLLWVEWPYGYPWAPQVKRLSRLSPVRSHLCSAPARSEQTARRRAEHDDHPRYAGSFSP